MKNTKKGAASSANNLTSTVNGVVESIEVQSNSQAPQSAAKEIIADEVLKATESKVIQVVKSDSISQIVKAVIKTAQADADACRVVSCILFGSPSIPEQLKDTSADNVRNLCQTYLHRVAEHFAYKTEDGRVCKSHKVGENLYQFELITSVEAVARIFVRDAFKNCYLMERKPVIVDLSKVYTKTGRDSYEVSTESAEKIEEIKTQYTAQKERATAEREYAKAVETIEENGARVVSQNHKTWDELSKAEQKLIVLRWCDENNCELTPKKAEQNKVKTA